MQIKVGFSGLEAKLSNPQRNLNITVGFCVKRTFVQLDKLNTKIDFTLPTTYLHKLLGHFGQGKGQTFDQPRSYCRAGHHPIQHFLSYENLSFNYSC